MPRLSAADLARAAEFERSLSVVQESSPPLYARLASELRDYLGAEKGCTYAATIGEDGLQLEFGHLEGAPGTPSSFREGMDRWIRSAGGQFGLYNPVRPEPFQRNKVLALGSFASMAKGHTGRLDARRLWRRSPVLRRRVLESLATAAEMFRSWDISHDDQLRLLICDGPVLLAWVGVFQPEPYTSRQIHLFHRISRALQFRARLEARMQGAPLYRAGLEAALEAVAGEAYIVTHGGRLLHANSAGRSAWDRSPISVAKRLAAARCGAPGFEVTPLSWQGGGQALLIIAAGTSSRDDRVRRAAARYGLTRRQTEVLVSLSAGNSTRRIAAELGCSERTVEVHISNLLDRMDADSRAELIAKALG